MKSVAATAEADAIAWLQRLKDEVSTPIVLRGKFVSFETMDVKRCLTMDEFRRFCDIAPQFIVEPVNAESWFNFGLVLYREPQAIYPGVTPELDSVFFISGEYLPEEVGHGFDSAWGALSPLSHSKENVRKLSRNGFEKPREKSYYDY